ncbi:MAG: carbon-nitrogen hydrolase family protein [Planktotalea sp.]|uniref:carbon-nitrogen hydrolase family protein n=1 Tax=Planktotalea sp. TaxID=2029877 RepID=UPI003C747CD4
MKIATAAYPLDWFDDWSAFEAKTRAWVSEAAGQGADLLVFPEYGSMELSSLAGRETSLDLEQSLHAVSTLIPDADALYTKLAAEFSVHILTPSAPVFDTAVHATRPVNRTRLIAPNGKSDIQDKQIMTMFERDPWHVATGSGPLKLFDTILGKIGVLICYDSEFPLLGRALIDAGAEYILVPSCTEALAGYWRVRLGAMSRALEGQCVTAMASIVGEVDWSQSVDLGSGMGGIFGPPDTGFPSTGVIAEGILNKAGWTIADAPRDLISHVRAHGIVRNATHWDEQNGSKSAIPVTYCDLR